MRQVMQRPDVIQKLHHLAIYPETTTLGTPEALAKFIREDAALMQRILKAANLAPEDAAPR
jgi:tripartite-type tricarboxylate transporter receptor subunit TctC